MTQGTKATRLSKAAREFNVGISTIVEFLHKKGVDIDPSPNTKVPSDIYSLLEREFSSDISLKKESEKLSLRNLREVKETISITDIEEHKSQEVSKSEEEVFIKDITGSPETMDEIPDEVESEARGKTGVKVVGKIDLDVAKTKEKPKTEKTEEDTEKIVPDKTEEKIAEKELDIKVVRKIDLDTLQKPEIKKKAKREKAPEEKEESVEETLTEHAEPGTELEKPGEIYRSKVTKLSGPTVIGKIDLPKKEKKKNTKSISRICGVLYIATVLAFLISNLILKNKQKGE